MRRTRIQTIQLRERRLAATIYLNQVANAAYALQQARLHLIHLTHLTSGAERETHLTALVRIYELERLLQALED